MQVEVETRRQLYLLTSSSVFALEIRLKKTALGASRGTCRENRDVKVLKLRSLFILSFIMNRQRIQGVGSTVSDRLWLAVRLKRSVLMGMVFIEDGQKKIYNNKKNPLFMLEPLLPRFAV